MRTKGISWVSALIPYAWGLAAAVFTSPAAAQTNTAPLAQVELPFALDSGSVGNSADSRGTVFSALVQAKGHSWIRLQFEDVQLGRTPLGGQPTVLRLTSMRDGAMQTLNAMQLAQWSNSSAYFNGPDVLLEIVADAGAPPSRVVMSQILASAYVSSQEDEGGVATICFNTDDRVLSNEKANGRLMPIGCTAWIFNDPARSMLTAGHCNPVPGSVLQFNIPPSAADGTVVNPPPQDQYPVDSASVQFLNNGIGNDWCYFGCFPNSVTGLKAVQAQQNQFYLLAPNPPALSSPAQPIRVTGFGTVSAPVSPTWNQVQKTHSGPYVGVSGTRVDYQVDTTGGNSGSPVVDLTTGMAFGIHTNGNCGPSGGWNMGTASHNPSLLNALAHPKGVCIPEPLLHFELPDGLPTTIAPQGDTLRVNVLPGHGGVPAANSGVLHVDMGSGFIEVPMQPCGVDQYDALFPAAQCLQPIRFYFSAKTTNGETVNDPASAPNTWLAATSAALSTVVFTDNFELDMGWTVTNDAGLTTGAWQRAVPIQSGQGDPESDGDGSGKCFVTDNVLYNDVDGGGTTLTSPLLNATLPNPALHFKMWFTTSSTVGLDFLRADVSPNGGVTWLTALTRTAPTSVWTDVLVPLASLPGFVATNQLRVRFVCADVGQGTLVEAAVDGVEIVSFYCQVPCAQDLNGNSVVDGGDLGILLGAWGSTASPADLDNSGVVDGGDLGMLLSAWGPCAP